MRFLETSLPGVFIIQLDRHEDNRGFFASMWHPHELEKHGLVSQLAHCSLSFNRTAGTLRGMHYQTAPYEEVKIVRCSRGAIYDVIVDLRRDSTTYKKWTAVELTPYNDSMLYVPRGVAHGFQTLEDDTEVVYLISEAYKPEHGRGVRWNDPAFSVEWPVVPGDRVMNERDRTYPDFIG